MLAVAVLAVAACTLAGPPPAARPRANEGRFVLYLNGPPKSPLQVMFELTAIEAERDVGVRAPVPLAPVRIDSLEVVDRQRLLAEAFLPPGRYRTLVLRIAKARTRQEGTWLDLAVPPEGFAVGVDFEIRTGQATPLFMTWDVSRTIEREVFLRPAFAFEGRAQELRRVLAYVTNEGSDTVSVIDRFTDRVVDVIEVGRAPRGIVVAPDKSRAFVVNALSQSLAVLDVNTNRVVHYTNLEAGAASADLAITPDGRTLYLTNTALNSVSAISTSSFQTLETIPVGLRPVALAMSPQRAQLLVANSGTNTVSVVDTARNVVAATLTVDFQPAAPAIDAGGTLALVPHLASPRLAVVSLTGLQVVRTVNPGPAAAALLDTDLAPSRVFLAQPRVNRVSFFDITLNAERDAIPVGDDPHRLVLDPEREKVYVVNRGSGDVTVIDKHSHRVRTTIQVGQRPYAMAIVP